jgi:hypothetical protein
MRRRRNADAGLGAVLEVGTWKWKEEGDGPPDVYFGTLNLSLSF